MSISSGAMSILVKLSVNISNSDIHDILPSGSNMYTFCIKINLFHTCYIPK